MLLPYIVGMISTISIIWLAYFIIVKYVIIHIDGEDDKTKAKKTTRQIATIITALVFAGFILYAGNMASVNDIPRNEIDRSGLEQGKNNFEEKIQKDANQPKTLSDTTKKQ